MCIIENVYLCNKRIMKKKKKKNIKDEVGSEFSSNKCN